MNNQAVHFIYMQPLQLSDDTLNAPVTQKHTRPPPIQQAPPYSGPAWLPGVGCPSETVTLHSTQAEPTVG